MQEYTPQLKNFLQFLNNYKRRNDTYNAVKYVGNVLHYVLSFVFIVSALSFVILSASYGITNYPSALGTLLAMVISFAALIAVSVSTKLIPHTIKLYTDLEEAKSFLINQKFKTIAKSKGMDIDKINSITPKEKKKTFNSFAVACDVLMSSAFSIFFSVVSVVIGVLSVLSLTGVVLSEQLPSLLVVMAVFCFITICTKIAEQICFPYFFKNGMTPAVSVTKALDRWDYLLNALVFNNPSCCLECTSGLDIEDSLYDTNNANTQANKLEQDQNQI